MLLKLAELTYPKTIDYIASKDECTEYAEDYEFNQVLSVTGKFTLEKDTAIAEGQEFVHLVGEVKAQVVTEANETKDIEEPIDIYLLASEDQEKFFELSQDIEIVEDQIFDLSIIIGQYLYLSSFEE